MKWIATDHFVPCFSALTLLVGTCSIQNSFPKWHIVSDRTSNLTHSLTLCMLVDGRRGHGVSALSHAAKEFKNETFIVVPRLANARRKCRLLSKLVTLAVSVLNGNLPLGLRFDYYNSCCYPMTLIFDVWHLGGTCVSCYNSSNIGYIRSTRILSCSFFAKDRLDYTICMQEV